MTAVVYLCRGKDPNWRGRLTRFITSWLEHPPGVECKLYAILKEFDAADDLNWATSRLGQLGAYNILSYVNVNSFAAGSFAEACRDVDEPLVCFLGSSSEIMHTGWLARLHVGLAMPCVGVACCTGSYGRITAFFPDLPYPNPHIRNLSFLIVKEYYQRMVDGKQFMSKLDDLHFEHGPDSLTRRIMRDGRIPVVVEKNRIIAPHEWGDTTYRGNLENVLVLDRGARDYQDI